MYLSHIWEILYYSKRLLLLLFCFVVVIPVLGQNVKQKFAVLFRKNKNKSMDYRIKIIRLLNCFNNKCVSAWELPTLTAVALIGERMFFPVVDSYTFSATCICITLGQMFSAGDWSGLHYMYYAALYWFVGEKKTKASFKNYG